MSENGYALLFSMKYSYNTAWQSSQCSHNHKITLTTMPIKHNDKYKIKLSKSVIVLLSKKYGPNLIICQKRDDPISFLPYEAYSYVYLTA